MVCENIVIGNIVKSLVVNGNIVFKFVKIVRKVSMVKLQSKSVLGTC